MLRLQICVHLQVCKSLLVIKKTRKAKAFFNSLQVPVQKHIYSSFLMVNSNKSMTYRYSCINPFIFILCDKSQSRDLSQISYMLYINWIEFRLNNFNCSRIQNKVIIFGYKKESLVKLYFSRSTRKTIYMCTYKENLAGCWNCDYLNLDHLKMAFF